MAIPAVVAIVFSLARRYLPVSDAETITVEEAHFFSSIQWLIATVMILVATCFGFASYYFLIWANRAMASHAPSPTFTLLPEHAMWFFFPFFGAICLTWELTIRLWMSAGDPSQARKYESWSNEKAGFNATRVLRLMSIGIALPIGLVTMLALPIYTTIDASGLTIGHFAKLKAQHHACSEIRTITVTQGLRTRDGGFQSRPAIVVDFSDGSRWSSADNRGTQKSIDQVLLTFLLEKTGLSANYIEAFPFGTA